LDFPASWLASMDIIAAVHLCEARSFGRATALYFGCSGLCVLLLPAIAGVTRPFKLTKRELNFKKLETYREVVMSSSKLSVWFIATTVLLSMSFVLYPQGSADAATYCAQLRGATAAGHSDCSFSTLDKCRARVRHRGGGHCYRSH
jgi:hypothetical protein